MKLKNFTPSQASWLEEAGKGTILKLQSTVDMVSPRGRCLYPRCFVQTQRTPLENGPEGHVALTSGPLLVEAADLLSGTPWHPGLASPHHIDVLSHLRKCA